MNFLKLLQKFIRPKDIDAEIIENRSHYRHLINDKHIASLHINEHLYSVIDLGYSGIAVEINNQSQFLNAAPKDTYIDAKLRLFDLTFSLKIKYIYQMPNRVAFRLAHDNEQELMLLREPLELMRRGQEMNKISQEYVKNTESSGGWQYFHGNIADDLRIKLNPDTNKLEEALLSILVQDHYEEVVWFKGQFSTRVAKQPLALGIKTEQTASIDPTYLRKSLCLLLGIKTNYPKDTGITQLWEECLLSWEKSQVRK